MNREYWRYKFAGQAMQGILSHPPHYLPDDFDGKDVASLSREYADALLAELDRTAPKPQPDADGWIAHRPGDAMPCDPLALVRVEFADGSRSMTAHVANSYHWTKRTEHPSANILAWKPADK